MRTWLLLGSCIAVIGLSWTVIHFLRQAASENDHRRQIEEAESDCVGKVPAAIDLVTWRDSMQGARIQVTGSANHYNRHMNQCLVEISTFEHQDTPTYVKTLVSPATKSAILWSFTEQGAARVCYSANSKALDCAEADQRWKTLMSE